MSEVPSDRRYTESHEWVQQLSDGTARIGITDHAQEAMGELVFVELPEPGAKVTRGEGIAVVESVKAASEIYAPASGTVTEINGALTGDPSLVNADSEGAGWMFKLDLSDPGEIDGLLDEGAYAEISK